MKLSLSFCTLAIALVGAVSASATPVTTSGLSVNSGGLTFSNFTCAYTSSGMNMGGCSSLDVSALTPKPAGIQFSTNLSVLGVASADAALAFTVSGSTGINQVGLSFNSNFLGMDVNSVTENIYTAQGGSLVGTMTVHCGVLTGCSSTTVDSVALKGTYTSLYITKDINLSSFAANGAGTTSIVTQSFTASPEPVSMSLIGGGLLLIGAARLRRNKA